MIHLLIVDPVEPGELSPPATFELLWASGAEEAAEKLARNRRIDAVLFFDRAIAAETARLLQAEDPSFPPLFLAGAGPEQPGRLGGNGRSEEHTSELQSLTNLVCRLLLGKKKT